MPPWLALDSSAALAAVESLRGALEDRGGERREIRVVWLFRGGPSDNRRFTTNTIDMIAAIIFDFNGVLVDDEAVHFELFRDVLAEEGITLLEHEYQAEYLGYDDRGCFEVALTRAGQSSGGDRIDALIARKASRYERLAETGLRFFSGAAEVVAALADHWPLAICSGALRGEIEFALERLGVRDRIGAIISAEDTERCKPDPEGYLLALDALRSVVGDDLEARHCLVIEDSLAGIESGKAAGMVVAAVAHTYSAAELYDSGADAVLDRIAAIDPDWILQTLAPWTSP